MTCPAGKAPFRRVWPALGAEMRQSPSEAASILRRQDRICFAVAGMLIAEFTAAIDARDSDVPTAIQEDRRATRAPCAAERGPRNRTGRLAHDRLTGKSTAHMILNTDPVAGKRESTGVSVVCKTAADHARCAMTLRRWLPLSRPPADPTEPAPDPSAQSIRICSDATKDPAAGDG